MQSDIIYRKVKKEDFDEVCSFVDYWLSGRAVKEGGGNDYFVTKRQHRAYFKNYKVFLAIHEEKIIGWAVKGTNNVLIHALVSAKYRGKGVGSELIKRLNPDIIRSKSDQMTGNPKEFYEKLGYKSILKKMVGKKKNIEMMTK